MLAIIIGVLIARSRLLPIIATLGMMYVFRGITYIVSGGSWVSAHQMPARFIDLATSSILGVNTLIVIAAVIYLIALYFD